MKNSQTNVRVFLWGCGGVLLSLVLAACETAVRTDRRSDAAFAFATAGDMRQFTNSAPAGKRYFDGACEALQKIGAGEFMITPGDFDPPASVRATLDRYLGSNYVWYVVVGNHEIETPEDMAWVRQWAARIPNLVRQGPPGAELTTYSFDFGNSHFIAVNDYFDGRLTSVSKGSLTDVTLDWLEKDLAATRQPLLWVIGHQPIESLPDMDSGRIRHRGETVSTNSPAAQRFTQLLQHYKVRAYICGHTHNTSVAKVNGIWQVDSGHARGGGDPGAPSSFLRFRVDGRRAWVDVYRSDTNGNNYQLRRTVALE